MYINTFQYSPEDVDCKLCTEYKRAAGCTRVACPWLAERIEAGVVSYEEAVRDTFPGDRHLGERLHTTIRLFPGSMFLTAGHRRRMEDMKIRMGYRRRRDTPAYYAAMYLLTANEELTSRTVNCFCRHGIEFGYAMVKDIRPHDYALFSAARDIYTDATGVAISDLANSGEVDPLAFSLIVNALLIARYGTAVLGIRERGRP